MLRERCDGEQASHRKAKSRDDDECGAIHYSNPLLAPALATRRRRIAPWSWHGGNVNAMALAEGWITGIKPVMTGEVVARGS